MTVDEIPAFFDYIDRITKILEVFHNNVKTFQQSQAHQGEVRQSIRSPLMHGLKIGKNDI